LAVGKMKNSVNEQRIVNKRHSQKIGKNKLALLKPDAYILIISFEENKYLKTSNIDRKKLSGMIGCSKTGISVTIILVISLGLTLAAAASLTK
jgi:hypothetical protein